MKVFCRSRLSSGVRMSVSSTLSAASSSSIASNLSATAKTAWRRVRGRSAVLSPSPSSSTFTSFTPLPAPTPKRHALRLFNRRRSGRCEALGMVGRGQVIYLGEEDVVVSGVMDEVDDGTAISKVQELLPVDLELDFGFDEAVKSQTHKTKSQRLVIVHSYEVSPEDEDDDTGDDIDEEEYRRHSDAVFTNLAVKSTAMYRTAFGPDTYDTNWI